MPPASRSSARAAASGAASGARAGRHSDVKGRPRRCTDVRDRRSLRGRVRSLGEVDRANEAGVDRLRISSSTVGRDGGVDRERDQRLAALGVAGDLHAGDVDLGRRRGSRRRCRPCRGGRRSVKNARWSVGSRSTSKPLTSTSRSRWAMPISVPRDRDLRAVGERAAEGDQVAVVGALGVGDQAYGDAALGGEQRRVDVGDLAPRRRRRRRP